ncbi:hypothetical protein [Nocardia asiatica]|uniref:hypothetical protein n=1 Tax=Nocardia asiatica TaxID=209252 RepID=UPI0002F7FFD1|nr:hypothetical protein [Nocardia asiatica]
MHISSGMGCPEGDGELLVVDTDTDTGRVLFCPTCEHTEPMNDSDTLGRVELADHTATAVLVDRSVMVHQISETQYNALIAHLGVPPSRYKSGRNVLFNARSDNCRSIQGLAQAIEYLRRAGLAYTEHLELRHTPPYPDTDPAPAPLEVPQAVTLLEKAATGLLGEDPDTDSRCEPPTRTPVSRDTV